MLRKTSVVQDSRNEDVCIQMHGVILSAMIALWKAVSR